MIPQASLVALAPAGGSTPTTTRSISGSVRTVTRQRSIIARGHSDPSASSSISPSSSCRASWVPP